MAGLYIHIPFCHSKCAYCDFFSTPNRKEEDLVTDCIIAEYELRRDEAAPINTIYLGGGTPSILSEHNLARLLSALPVGDATEVTIEVNPEDVTRESVALWRGLGINRVSMGVQSLVDSELSLIGRRHNAADASKAVETLRDGGISNFSIDLIYSLPSQTLESWQYSLDWMMRLSPPHFSAYMLSYEPHTRLSAMLDKGKIQAVDECTALTMYQMLISQARSHGYEHYEISNFSKPGHRSVHNSSYWHNVAYIGLGPAAHSFDGKVRRVNPSSIKNYTQALLTHQPAYTIEEESKVEKFNDLVITSLRTKEGLPFKGIPVRRRRQFLCDAYKYIESGQIEIINNTVSIPEEHWMVSDAIFRDLIQV